MSEIKIANVVLGDSRVKPDWRRLRGWLKRHYPDIVTLQKIGPGEPSFEDDVCEIGYEGCFLHHERCDRGVGILANRDFLSRYDKSLSQVLYPKIPDVDINEPCFPNETRFLTVSIGDLWVSSVYAPYGPKSLSSREAIERRVAWLNRLRDNVRIAAHDRWLLCGDFNVRADDGSKGKLKHALEELKNLGLCDLYRQAHPDPEEMPGYTRGCGQKFPSRLHLILASASLAQRLRSARMEPESSLWPRKGAPPLIVGLDDV